MATPIVTYQSRALVRFENAWLECLYIKTQNVWAGSHDIQYIVSKLNALERPLRSLQNFGVENGYNEKQDYTFAGNPISIIKPYTEITPLFTGYPASPYIKLGDIGAAYGYAPETTKYYNESDTNFTYLILVYDSYNDIYQFIAYFNNNPTIKKGDILYNANKSGSSTYKSIDYNGEIGTTILLDKVLYDDPYESGGASTIGGGGGSFDGTTEIINEPDSPLVNISNTHFVSLYNPTESQIKSLSDYMWNTLAIENWRKIVADPMDAIISLAVLPIDVPSSGTREIYVGAFSTGIACNVASAQYISFDCGTLLIPQYSNSYLDYAPYTDISIYIPYVGLRSLPCDAIMGKTIGLKYRIDIFSGACVVYLTVNGSVLLQFTGNCAQPIPFTSQSWGTAVTNAISMVASGASMIAMPATAPLAIANMASTAVNGGFKADITKGGGSGGNTGFLGVQKPYVIIQRPVQCIPANQNTFTGYPSYITATFGDLKGYTEVDKIILENINATESELNELETILKGGVYVNEL